MLTNIEFIDQDVDINKNISYVPKNCVSPLSNNRRKKGMRTDDHTLQLRRSACHRCGNVRKNTLDCMKCPNIYCISCASKMKEDHGEAVFNQGCPWCLNLCCCSCRSAECNRKFHCYKRCPIAKKTTGSMVGSAVGDSTTMINSKRPRTETHQLNSMVQYPIVSAQNLSIEVPNSAALNLVSPNVKDCAITTPVSDLTISSSYSPSIKVQSVHPKLNLNSTRKNLNIQSIAKKVGEQPGSICAVKMRSRIKRSTSEHTTSTSHDELLAKRMEEVTRASFILKQKTEQLGEQYQTLGDKGSIEGFQMDFHSLNNFSFTRNETPTPPFVPNDAASFVAVHKAPLSLKLQPLRDLFRGSPIESEIFMSGCNDVENLGSISRLPPRSMCSSRNVPPLLFLNNTTLSMLGDTAGTIRPTDEMIFAPYYENPIELESRLSCPKPVENCPLPVNYATLHPNSILTASVTTSINAGEHRNKRNENSIQSVSRSNQTAISTIEDPSKNSVQNTSTQVEWMQNPLHNSWSDDASDIEIHNQLLVAITSLRYCKNVVLSTSERN